MELKPINRICPHCGNGNYMRIIEGKNVGKLNVKCINCNSYFNYDELNQEGGKNQTMADLILREAGIEAAIYGADDWDGGYNPERERYIRKHMAKVSAVDAVPVVHGHWTHIHIKGKEYGKVYYQHENCAPLLFESPYHYCPHCGARMDGEEK